MISICIPIYNTDVRELVYDLKKQIETVNEQSIEIILIDDASKEEYKKYNQELKNDFIYIELTDNIGRSKIRNLFLTLTTQPYLLFLDCDGLIKNNHRFISNYIRAVNDNLDVVCGTRIYSERCPSKKFSLNWKYGKNIESFAIERSFMSNNFLIKKTVFKSILFDEKIKGYGHEDTFFGIELAKKNININIINNPIYNNHLETNKNYLDKNISSLKNLIYLIQSSKIEKNNFNRIKLLRTYYFLKKIQFIPIYLIFYKAFRKYIYCNLLSANPSLFVFNLYKLGEFIKLKKESI